ncbi:MAG TPA: EF-P beta-lysylation protein EpmB, partial [Acidiferrobacteraceae bacterium]|nr:EF-P beta-lysylation protein EpmB [Acidiferrobacteraceae bacterium]
MPLATPAWARALGAAVTDPRELLALLELPDMHAWSGGFGLRVPRSYVARMRTGDPCDPLFLQVWPAVAEALEVAGFGPDPVGDCRFRKAPGVLQKYAGRALLSVTGACAVHCRYCFRRHFPYTAENPLGQAWGGTLQVLQRSPDLREVILSGGDPLMLPDERLATLVQD